MCVSIMRLGAAACALASAKRPAVRNRRRLAADRSGWRHAFSSRTATKLVVCQTGERFVDVAAELLTDALRALDLARQPIVFAFDVQLQLPIAA